MVFMALTKPQLPDVFDDFVVAHLGKPPTNAFKAYCRRMIYHEQWMCILDDDFMDAYTHGIVIDCFDVILRRFYPRIFIYSNDYLEKYVSEFISGMRLCFELV